MRHSRGGRLAPSPGELESEDLFTGMMKKDAFKDSRVSRLSLT